MNQYYFIFFVVESKSTSNSNQKKLILERSYFWLGKKSCAYIPVQNLTYFTLNLFSSLREGIQAAKASLSLHF